MNFNDAELLKNIDIFFDVAKTLTSESVKGEVASKKNAHQSNNGRNDG